LARSLAPGLPVLSCLPRGLLVVRYEPGPRHMKALESLFRIESLASAGPLLFAGVLLLILIISFRSRAVVFCQYLETMTGISLKPSDVRRIYRKRGKNGVREMFLDLIIREDLKEGPIEMPEEERAQSNRCYAARTS